MYLYLYLTSSDLAEFLMTFGFSTTAELLLMHVTVCLIDYFFLINFVMIIS